MEKICINILKLGRIENSKLEISPLTIFSGESGLGKSYLAILCHYFFELMINPERLNDFFKSKWFIYENMSNSFKNSGIALSIDKKDLENWLSEDSKKYLGFMLNNKEFTADYSISLPNNIPNNLEIKYKEELRGLVDEDDIIILLSLDDINYRTNTKTSIINNSSPYAILLDAYFRKNIIGALDKLESTFVLPPSRGPILTEKVDGRSGLYQRYITDIEDLKIAQENPINPSDELIELFHSILDGEIEYSNNEYIYITDSAQMPLSAAAASIRELAPLEQFIKKGYVSQSAILMEEPEAHLHPFKQRMMADIISCLINTGAYMQITTHSDYFLRRLNELIMLNEIKSKYSNDEYEDICKQINANQKLNLDKSKISAYLLEMEPDGSSKIISQNISEGIPFSAFHKAIDDNLNFLNILEDKLESE